VGGRSGFGTVHFQGLFQGIAQVVQQFFSGLAL
jgi:hypothetical protein